MLCYQIPPTTCVGWHATPSTFAASGSLEVLDQFLFKRSFEPPDFRWSGRLVLLASRPILTNFWTTSTALLAAHQGHRATGQFHLLEQALVIAEQTFVAPAPTVKLHGHVVAQLPSIQHIGQQPNVAILGGHTQQANTDRWQAVLAHFVWPVIDSP